ncbi:MAG TPA: addiction module protein [Phycisphaerae bacterium]|nr:addiction module protein [Phycisphaerae bacterium]
MADVKDIIHEAESLPVEERAALADSILRTLNRPDPAMDERWLMVARRRLEELRSGRAQAVPGDEVFAKADERFKR